MSHWKYKRKCENDQDLSLEDIKIEDKDVYTVSIDVLKFNPETKTREMVPLTYCFTKEELQTILTYKLPESKHSVNVLGQNEDLPYIIQPEGKDLGKIFTAQRNREFWLYRIPYFNVFTDYSFYVLFVNKIRYIKLIKQEEKSTVFRSQGVSSFHDREEYIYTAVNGYDYNYDNLLESCEDASLLKSTIDDIEFLIKETGDTKLLLVSLRCLKSLPEAEQEEYKIKILMLARQVYDIFHDQYSSYYLLNIMIDTEPMSPKILDFFNKMIEIRKIEEYYPHALLLEQHIDSIVNQHNKFEYMIRQGIKTYLRLFEFYIQLREYAHKQRKNNNEYSDSVIRIKQKIIELYYSLVEEKSQKKFDIERKKNEDSVNALQEIIEDTKNTISVHELRELANNIKQNKNINNLLLALEIYYVLWFDTPIYQLTKDDEDYLSSVRISEYIQFEFLAIQNLQDESEIFDQPDEEDENGWDEQQTDKNEEDDESGWE